MLTPIWFLGMLLGFQGCGRSFRDKVSTVGETVEDLAEKGLNALNPNVPSLENTTWVGYEIPRSAKEEGIRSLMVFFGEEGFLRVKYEGLSSVEGRFFAGENRMVWDMGQTSSSWPHPGVIALEYEKTSDTDLVISDSEHRWDYLLKQAASSAAFFPSEAWRGNWQCAVGRSFLTLTLEHSRCGVLFGGPSSLFLDMDCPPEDNKAWKASFEMQGQHFCLDLSFDEKGGARGSLSLCQEDRGSPMECRQLASSDH